MNHKVLLADDSLTIQKVIKITLANQPFDITDCSTEDELFHQLPILQPKIVFLDFNLSEKFTGYELTQKIKSVLPATKVLLLLGTFDTVDDASMEKCGASDKIVKPFDSNKFIAISKQLIETFADEEIAYPESKSEATIEPDSDDQWTVSHTTDHKLEKAEADKPLDDSFPAVENPLLKEMSDWGMSIPPSLSEASADFADLPPVISTPKESRPKGADVTREDIKFPVSDDLDYPSFDNVTSLPIKENKESPYIQMNVNESIDLTLEGSFVPEEESDVSKIEEQIRDEVEENLWQVDEFENLKNEVAAKMDEVKNNFQPSSKDFDESLFKPLNEAQDDIFSPRVESKPQTQVPSLEAVRAEMEGMVKKYVKEYMDQYFKENVEKVSWEVIPDLAENLIRQEISKISHKILNE